LQTFPEYAGYFVANKNSNALEDIKSKTTKLNMYNLNPVSTELRKGIFTALYIE
jgi:hypothetical protein